MNKRERSNVHSMKKEEKLGPEPLFLEMGESRWKAVCLLLNRIGAIYYRCGEDGNFIFLGGPVERLTGYSREDFMQGNVKWLDLVHQEDLSVYARLKQSLANFTNQVAEEEYRIISSRGDLFWVKEWALLFSKDGLTQIEGFIMDVTEKKMVEYRIRDREFYLESILGSVKDVIWSVKPDTFELLYINQVASSLYGYSLEEIYARCREGDQSCIYLTPDVFLDHFDTLLTQGAFELEFEITRPDGEKRWIHRRVYFGRDYRGNIARIDGLDSDITERKRAEDQLIFLSFHDALTGLYNRAYFEQEIKRLEEAGTKRIGIMVCDVDGLKWVNDNLGHDAGDRLLVTIAEILRGTVRERGMVARIGGDEFVVLLEKCTLKGLSGLAQELEETVEKRRTTDPSLPVSMSLGYAVRSGKMSMLDVFRLADNRMYQAKKNKR